MMTLTSLSMASCWVSTPEATQTPEPEADFRAMGKQGAAKRWGAGKDKATKKAGPSQLSQAFNACTMDGQVTLYAMAEYLDLKPATVKRRLREAGGYWIDGERVGRLEPGSRG